MLQIAPATVQKAVVPNAHFGASPLRGAVCNLASLGKACARVFCSFCVRLDAPLNFPLSLKSNFRWMQWVLPCLTGKSVWNYCILHVVSSKTIQRLRLVCNKALAHSTANLIQTQWLQEIPKPGRRAEGLLKYEVGLAQASPWALLPQWLT